MSKPLRTVLLYSDGHLGSTIVFNILDTAPEFDIVGVMCAKPIPLTKKGKSQFFRYIHKVGFRFAWVLMWQYLAQKIVISITAFIPLWRDSALLPSKTLARRRGIPTIKCHDINSELGKNFLSKLAPDLIISSYFSQIIDTPILKIPKIGVINIHPGWLPSYRGSLSYFWALKNGEQKAGVSIHWMDEGLDTGAIIDRKKFRIEAGSTQQQVLIETALIAGRMLQRSARKILRGITIKPIDISAEQANYYSMPTDIDFANYYKQRNYFRLGDLFRITRYGVKKRRMRKERKISN